MYRDGPQVPAPSTSTLTPPTWFVALCGLAALVIGVTFGHAWGVTSSDDRQAATCRDALLSFTEPYSLKFQIECPHPTQRMWQAAGQIHCTCPRADDPANMRADVEWLKAEAGRLQSVSDRQRETVDARLKDLDSRTVLLSDWLADVTGSRVPPKKKP